MRTRLTDDRARTLARLVMEAAKKYDFEPRHPAAATPEALDAWLHALIRHVEQRDWAAAFELMIGKRQTDWSPDDVQTFKNRRLSGVGPKREFTPADGCVTLAGIEDPGPYDTTPEALLQQARLGLDWYVAERTAKPQADLPIFASVLLQNGHCLTVPCDSTNRIAVLKVLAQRQPVYGFWLIFDAFMHMIDETAGKATKRDVILCQVGTREMRRVLRRSYEVRDGVTRFDDPLPDIHEDALRDGSDPYAEVFVSVPTSDGIQ